MEVTFIKKEEIQPTRKMKGEEISPLYSNFASWFDMLYLGRKGKKERGKKGGEEDGGGDE